MEVDENEEVVNESNRRSENEEEEASSKAKENQPSMTSFMCFVGEKRDFFYKENMTNIELGKILVSEFNKLQPHMKAKYEKLSIEMSAVDDLIRRDQQM